MRNILLSFFVFFQIISCNRQEILDSHAADYLIKIENAADIEKMLRNKFLYDWFSNIPNLITDEIQYNASKIQNFDWRDESFYFWKDDFVTNNEGYEDWRNYYTKILYANTIIEFYQNKTLSDDDKQFLSIAYFIRSNTYFQLMLVHTDADIHSTVKLGVPIRLKDDLAEKVVQWSLKDSYQFIRNDLETSLKLIEEIQKIQKPLISLNEKWVYAFASRLYLFLGEYPLSLTYSNILLHSPETQIKNLNEYTNQVSLQFLQPEKISQTSYYNIGSTLLSHTNDDVYINDDLISLYNDNDLRKNIWFSYRNGRYYYKNPYLVVGHAYFNGFTYPEIYLNKLECEFRLGLTEYYQFSFDFWLKRRYKNSASLELDSLTNLEFILQERSRELVLRDLKLFDVKRVYRDGINISIKKILHQEAILLTAADARINIIYPPNILQEYQLKQVNRN